MKTEIKILPETVQNKIAAGEVIERPASVVKELCENAIDAGATKITIEIENGGGDLIRVTDNGSGMNPENLELCVERHATSKIREVDDIFTISTLGFRGEALPSIGAVARLTINSGESPEREGRRLTVVGGAREPLMPAPPRRGTIVEARDLFFNTPARRKFMKSPAAETSQITETITRLALGYPEKSFYLSNHGRRTLELPEAANLRARIVDLFGDTFTLLPVNYADHGLQIVGFIAAPPESRANSRQIYTLLNRRWFRHSGLLRALADACAGNLPPRRFPFAVLDFTIDSERVDINAHPTKEVIRFENEQILIGGAHHAVQLALGLGGMPPLPSADFQSQRVRDAAATYCAKHSSAQKGAPQLPPIETSRGKNFAFSGKSNSAAARPLPINGCKFSSGESQINSRGNFADAVSTNTENAENAGNFAPPTATAPLLNGGDWHFLGQAGGKYLVVETPSGLLLVDQHALHERYNYEQLKKRQSPITQQKLLTPMEIKLTAGERSTLAAALPLLVELGFIAETSAEENLLLTACPDFLSGEQTREVIRDLLTSDSTLPLTQRRDNLLAKIACHSSVRFGTNLSAAANYDLLEKFLNNYLPTCPHGRPTVITLTWEELARKFGR